MVRLLPLLALLPLVAPAAHAADPATERFRKFFKEEFSAKYAAQKFSEERVALLAGFDQHDVADASRWLILEVLAKEAEADIVREAVRVLGTYKNPDNTDEIAKLYGSAKKWEVRALLLEAVAPRKSDAAGKLIAQGLKDKDPRVACAAARAAGTGRQNALRPALEALLKHKHAAVRAAALRGLSELLGDESLPAIFHAFCGDPSARVRYDAWLALTKVAKEDLPCDPAAWESFWTKLAGEVAEGEKNPWGTAFPKIEPKAGRAGNFFGIPLLGDRICFVLDTTDDMRTSWNIDFEAEARKPPGERMPDSERGKTRWTLVRAYVMQCLEALPEATELGFVFFDKKATPWPDDGQLLRNTAKARADAQSALERAPLGTSTAMYEGLAAGWGFVRGGDLANFEKGADTIVFVTDGVPTAGEMSGRSARLRDEVWLVATLRNVRFHTVGLHNHDYELLKAMARDSGGLYVHFQQAGDTADPQDLDFWPKKRKALEEARKAQRAGG